MQTSVDRHKTYSVDCTIIEYPQTWLTLAACTMQEAERCSALARACCSADTNHITPTDLQLIPRHRSENECNPNYETRAAPTAAARRTKETVYHRVPTESLTDQPKKGI